MAQERISYYLTISSKDIENQTIEVCEKIVLGSHEEADICLQDFGLAPRHCIFQERNDVFTITLLVDDSTVKIGRQKVDQGRMYILEEKDKITIKDITLKVTKEKSKNLSQIIDNRSSIESVKSNLEKKVSKKDTLDIPNVFHRFCSYSFESLLIYLILFQNTNHPLIKKLLLSCNELLSEKILPKANLSVSINNNLEIFSNAIVISILFYVLFFAQKIVFNILFGSELGQILFGLTTQGGAISKRIKSVLRVIFYFFTSPIILFDISSIFKRRTLKEVIFQAAIVRQEGKSFFPRFTLAVMILASLFCAPYFIIKGHNIKLTTNQMYFTIKKTQDDLPLAFLSSQEIQLNLTPKENYHFIPFFNKNNVQLFGLSSTRDDSFTYKHYKDIPLDELIRPDLFVTEPLYMVKKPADKIYGALNLSFETFSQFFLGFGAHYWHYLKLKTIIINKLNITPESEISLIRRKDFDILIIDDKTNRTKIAFLKKEVPQEKITFFELKSKKRSNIKKWFINSLTRKSSPLLELSYPESDFSALDTFNALYNLVYLESDSGKNNQIVAFFQKVFDESSNNQYIKIYLEKAMEKILNENNTFDEHLYQSDIQSLKESLKALKDQHMNSPDTLKVETPETEETFDENN